MDLVNLELLYVVVIPTIVGIIGILGARGSIDKKLGVFRIIVGLCIVTLGILATVQGKSIIIIGLIFTIGAELTGVGIGKLDEIRLKHST